MQARNSPFCSSDPASWNRRRLESICGWSHRMPGHLRSSTRSWLCWHSGCEWEGQTIMNYSSIMIENYQFNWLKIHLNFKLTGYPFVLNAAHLRRLSFMLVGDFANDGLLTAAVDGPLCWSIILNLSFALTTETAESLWVSERWSKLFNIEGLQGLNKA